MFNMAPAFTTCLFFSCFFLERWSLVSLQGTYPKPSVKLSPGSLVARGGSLTINCTSEYPHMSFFLYKGIDIYLREDPPGSEAVFAINGVRETDEGDYHCRYHPRSGGGVWSDASDPFQIRVLDLSKPYISYTPLWSREGDYKITCSALQDKAVKRFFLYQNGGKAAKTDRSPSPQSQSVTFPISDVNARAGTEYRCSYQIQESGESVESPLSDPIQIGKENEQETSTATTPRSMDDTLIIAVVCAVLLVVILVVAFILYIKCKPKKANGDIQKRNLPLNEEKKTDSLEPMYAIVTKVKTSNNTITPEVKKQEEGGYDEGLTYAVINKDALKNKKKNSAPPFQEPEPTLYASVNIH